MAEASIVSDIEFVNREQELAFLASLLPPAATKSSLVILRAPSGFGKSRLTDEFTRRIRPSLLVAVVDPLIRLRSGAPRIYDGFFIQRAALELSNAMGGLGRIDHTFERFLARRRWTNVRQREWRRDLQSMPGMRTAYSAAVQYFERFFALGRYGPGELLRSDTRDAVSVCVDYVTAVCALERTVVVVRETQHIDHESLRTFLQLNTSIANQHLVLEYTSQDGRFDPDHEKLLQRELIGHPNAHLLDLLRLGRGHLEYLLRQLSPQDVELNSEFYGRWDGNLRLLGELQYRTSVRRRLLDAGDIARGPNSLSERIQEHISELTSSQTWLLAVIAAHVEPLHRRALLEAALSAAPHTTERSLSDDLEALSQRHAFIDLRGDEVSLAHEDLAVVVRNSSNISGLIALGEKSLRDWYLRIVRDQNFAVASLAVATRRAFLFCARTRDIGLLIRLIDEFDEQVRAANDHGMYIDIACEAVMGSMDLLPGEQARMVDWAAKLAYEINDFRNTIKLLDQLPKQSVLEATMLGFSATETGSHERAQSISRGLRGDTEDKVAPLVADLIDASDALDRGAWDECRQLLGKVIEIGKVERLPLVGHALRLLAEIEEYPTCTAIAIESADWYRSLGLMRCAAYSELSASRFFARTGRSEDAVRLIESATEILREGPSNRHILFNNRALVGLLAPAPDFDRCADWLREAMRTSRDDFADLTILSNLAIAHWKRGDYSQALECVTRCNPILDHPEFSERDVFWPVCFNLGQVLDASGERAEARRMRERPRATGWKVRINEGYWAYRFGEVTKPDSTLAFLYRFDYHPTALSQWQLDLEALVALKRGSPL